MRKPAVLGLAAIALTALACGSASNTQGPGAQSSDAATAAASIIKLEVTGPASADITYGLGADQSQENGAKLPWTKDLTSGERFNVVSLVAQSKGTTAITCRITIDGKVVKENRSSGQYAVVTCSGS